MARPAIGGPHDRGEGGEAPGRVPRQWVNRRVLILREKERAAGTSGDRTGHLSGSETTQLPWGGTGRKGEGRTVGMVCPPGPRSFSGISSISVRFKVRLSEPR